MTERMVELAMLAVAAVIFYAAVRKALRGRARYRAFRPRNYDDWHEWQ